jgi:hypothetical protein
MSCLGLPKVETGDRHYFVSLMPLPFGCPAEIGLSPKAVYLTHIWLNLAQQPCISPGGTTA